jgi:hypothetical protein
MKMSEVAVQETSDKRTRALVDEAGDVNETRLFEVFEELGAVKVVISGIRCWRIRHGNIGVPDSRVFLLSESVQVGFECDAITVTDKQGKEISLDEFLRDVDDGTIAKGFDIFWCETALERDIHIRDYSADEFHIGTIILYVQERQAEYRDWWRDRIWELSQPKTTDNKGPIDG